MTSAIVVVGVRVEGNMKTAKELREKFEKDLKELQDNCKHKDTEWLPNLFAPGHFHGQVKVCKKCSKRLEEKAGDNITYNITTTDVNSIGYETRSDGSRIIRSF